LLEFQKWPQLSIAQRQPGHARSASELSPYLIEIWTEKRAEILTVLAKKSKYFLPGGCSG
jgi:hypothetical protein